MPLWTDAYFVTSADLANVESEVTDVAEASNITIDGPNGIIEQVRQETQAKILGEMQRFGGYLSSGLVSSNHMSAVFNVGGPGVNRTRITMGQVCIDPFVPLVKTWFQYVCLDRFYRTAQARSDVDRYKVKREQYQEDIKYTYWPNLKNVGLPIVARPAPAPGALFERASGTWGAGNVGPTAHGDLMGGTFFVAITWVDQVDGYVSQINKGNCESYISAPQTVTIGAANALTITLAGLNPPTGQSGGANLAQAVVNPLTATGWNVYVGQSSTGPFYLQNSFPIPITSTSYTLPGDPVFSGYTSDNGQYPDYYYTMQDLIQRG